LTRADFAPAAGMPVARRGAKFGITDAPVELIWAPGLGVDFAVEFTGMLPTLTGTQTAMGHFSSGTISPTVNADGSIDFNVGGLTIASTAGLITAGEWFHIRATRVGTTGTVYLNGVQVASGTVSGNAVQVSRLGGWRSSDRRWNGCMYDVLLEITGNDSETAYFALDTLNASGEYPNTHPGSTVGNATVSGTVLPVEINAVTAGAPVPVGPVVGMWSRTALQTQGTVLLDAVVDPYGWESGSEVHPTVPGIAVISVTGRIHAATIATPPLEPEVRLRNNNPVETVASQTLTLDTLDEWVSVAFTCAVELDGTEEFLLQIVNVTDGNAVNADDVYLTLTLYPDLS